MAPDGHWERRFFQPTLDGVRPEGPEGKTVQPGMVGVVFQNYVLFEHRTVLGNLAVAAEHAGLSRKNAIERSQEMLKQFGLEDFAKRYPVQMSGGQRQRVAIAQQFVCSQHFLLMDEPFSGLDPLAVENVCRLVTEVANLDELNTIIVVTHNIEAAMQVADTVIILGRDRNEAGTPIPGARVQETINLDGRRPGLARGPQQHAGVRRGGTEDPGAVSDALEGQKAEGRRQRRGAPGFAVPVSTSS